MRLIVRLGKHRETQRLPVVGSSRERPEMANDAAGEKSGPTEDSDGALVGGHHGSTAHVGMVPTNVAVLPASMTSATSNRWGSVQTSRISSLHLDDPPTPTQQLASVVQFGQSAGSSSCIFDVLDSNHCEPPHVSAMSSLIRVISRPLPLNSVVVTSRGVPDFALFKSSMPLARYQVSFLSQLAR